MKAGVVGLALVCACAQAEAAESAAPASMDGLIARHAAATGVPEALIRRVIVRESRYNPAARNRGHYGLMQIKPATAKAMGYQGGPDGLLDADTNLTYGVRYLLGAYKVASGDHGRAMRLYASGYYYDAKRRGMLAEIGLGRKARPAGATVAAAPEAAAAPATATVMLKTRPAPSPALSNATVAAAPAALAYAPSATAPSLTAVAAPGSKRIEATNAAPISAFAPPLPTSSPSRPQNAATPPAIAASARAPGRTIAAASPAVLQPTAPTGVPAPAAKRIVAMNAAPMAAAAGPVGRARPPVPTAKPALAAAAPTPPIKDADLRTGSIAPRPALRP